MTAGLQFINSSLIEDTLRRARESARRRTNHNFHSAPGDNPHRFLNVFLKGSYVAPHRHLHPPKSETFLVLDGHMAVFCFDDAGSVTGRYLIGPEPKEDAPAGLPYAGIGLDIAPGVWHTVTAVSEEAVCFEVKPGPWDPASDKEFAAWAPREGDPAATGWMQKLLHG